jgi:hypothetical protein
MAAVNKQDGGGLEEEILVRGDINFAFHSCV